MLEAGRVIHRLLALLGSIAHGIRQFAATILGMVGLRAVARFVVPALVVLLALGAVQSARETAAVLESRPDVTEATLTEVAAYEGEGGSVWYQFDALIDDTHFATEADVGTFFYVARDPADPATGLLVRSPRNDAFFRQRVVGAAIVEDPEVVADALERLGAIPPGFTVERDRFLDEMEAGGDPEVAFEPPELSEEPAGSSLLVHGRIVSPERLSACAVDDCGGENAAYVYLFADVDGGTSYVLRSPHPPDAIPVRIEGLYLRDSFDLAPVVDSDWFADIDDGVSGDRSLFAGTRPPITVEASWVPAILLGGIALLLLASHLIGYPVFRPQAPASPRRELEPGEGIDLEITGSLAREQGRLALWRSPGSLERLTIAELALRMWRYGMVPRDLSRREAEERFVAEAAGDTDRLVINERDQSALVVVGRDGDTRVEAGHLYRVAGSQPALRFRQGGSDAYLAARSERDRDHAAGEILGEATPG